MPRPSISSRRWPDDLQHHCHPELRAASHGGRGKMTFTADRLASLLPTLYRLRDAERGRPFHALLEAFAGELAALEENIEQLYDDQFIETCADWVVPYIGDLIGYRPMHGVAPKISAPRSEVANTIRFRRRKGTALMLEEKATDV